MERSVVSREGQIVYAIEAIDSSPSPLRGAADAAGAALAGLGDVGAVIASACEDIIGAMKAGLAASAPDEVELTFGVSVTAEGSVPLIVKASGQATIGVKAVWRDNR